MEVVRILTRRGFILSWFFIFSNCLYSQERVYSKYHVGLQLFSEHILSNNAIILNKDGKIYDDYLYFLKENYPEIVNQSPRSLFELNQARILGNINGGYNFDYYNSLELYLQFSFRYNLLKQYNENSAFAYNTDFGDLNFNLVYFRGIDISKSIRLKLGMGVGVVFSSVDDLNNIYGLTQFSNASYNNKNAFYFEDNTKVATTEVLFRNSIDFNLTPRFQLEFTKERKSYFSLIGGMNIMPFDYQGIETKVYDLSTRQIINSLNTKFKNTTLFIGLGYTFGWKEREK